MLCVFLKKLAKVFFRLASIVEITPLTFSGWKMATGTQAPWRDCDGNRFSRTLPLAMNAWRAFSRRDRSILLSSERKE